MIDTLRKAGYHTVLGTAAVLFLVFLAPDALAAGFDSPRAQLASGVDPQDVGCNDALVLVMRLGNTPSCTSEATAQRMSWPVIARSFDVPDTNVDDTNTGDTEPANTPQDPQQDPVDAPTITYAPVPADVADSNNQFALDFYRQISFDGNIFFSPISMHTAFSVLYEGANGNTAAEIRQVFGLEPDDTARHDLMAQTISSINREDPHATLNAANALWIADWFAPYESYLDIVNKTYHASSQTVDFTDPDDGVKRINQWASDNTNGKITKVLEQGHVNASTAMVINNAIYFKGTWVTQFAEEDTFESDFWTGSENTIRADFMHVEDTFDYAMSDGAHVLRLPYEGDRLSMLVILPEDRDGIASLEESISTDMLEQWRDDMHSENIIVEIPKFTAKIHYDLKPLLQNMGMIDVFVKAEADLLGIGPVVHGSNLYISHAFHDSFVDVNEEGTEAAAVTTMTMLTSLPPTFMADHPFIFVIQDDESGTILFMGKISDPTCMDKEC